VLKDSGVEFEVVEYLKNPPPKETLRKICDGLGKEPFELVRVKDKRFKELGLSKQDNRGQEDWLDLLVENPSLIERPIVIYAGKFALGRPIETIGEILKSSD